MGAAQGTRNELNGVLSSGGVEGWLTLGLVILHAQKIIGCSIITTGDIQFDLERQQKKST